MRALGARAVFLEAENLPLYHAGAVIASNYVVALADVARGLLVKAGVPEDQALPALIPLLSSVVQNLAHARAARRAHRPGRAGRRVVGGATPAHARGSARPSCCDLYRRVGRDVLRLAREKSALEPATVARLESLFRAPWQRLRRRDKRRSNVDVDVTEWLATGRPDPEREEKKR